jgi:hypothetical protein
VLGRGKPVNVAYSGGTAFNFVNNTPDPGIKNFQTYIESQKHMAAKAASTGATVLLSNHSEFDNTFNKNECSPAAVKVRIHTNSGPIGSSAISRSCRVARGRRS